MKRRRASDAEVSQNAGSSNAEPALEMEGSGLDEHAVSLEMRAAVKRATCLMRLRQAAPPRTYEDCCNQLQNTLLRMLTETRVQQFGWPGEVSNLEIIMSTDYSGMGTAEYVMGELKDGEMGMSWLTLAGGVLKPSLEILSIFVVEVS